MTILILFLWITIESECKYMVFFNTTKIIAFFYFLKICRHVFFLFFRLPEFSCPLPGEWLLFPIFLVWVD